MQSATSKMSEVVRETYRWTSLTPMWWARHRHASKHFVQYSRNVIFLQSTLNFFLQVVLSCTFYMVKEVAGGAEGMLLLLNPQNPMSLRWATEEAALQLPWLSVLKWWFLGVKWHIYWGWACSQVWEPSPYLIENKAKWRGGGLIWVW